MSFLDPKPLTAVAAAAQASNPATVLGAALSATILALTTPSTLDGGNATSSYSGTFNFDGGSAT